MLLDTDVLIDIARGYPPALHWLSTAPSGVEYCVSGYTAMEVISGCETKMRLQRAKSLLSRFEVIWLAPNECERALSLFETHRLSHGAGIIDTLIGYTAVVNEMPIFTFNRKHFRYLPGIEIVELYSRHRNG